MQLRHRRVDCTTDGVDMGESTRAHLPVKGADEPLITGLFEDKLSGTAMDDLDFASRQDGLALSRFFRDVLNDAPNVLPTCDENPDGMLILHEDAHNTTGTVLGESQPESRVSNLGTLPWQPMFPPTPHPCVSMVVDNTYSSNGIQNLYEQQPMIQGFVGGISPDRFAIPLPARGALCVPSEPAYIPNNQICVETNGAVSFRSPPQTTGALGLPPQAAFVPTSQEIVQGISADGSANSSQATEHLSSPPKAASSGSGTPAPVKFWDEDSQEFWELVVGLICDLAQLKGNKRDSWEFRPGVYVFPKKGWLSLADFTNLLKKADEAAKAALRPVQMIFACDLRKGAGPGCKVGLLCWYYLCLTL
jgi:hypothetical protein